MKNVTLSADEDLIEKARSVAKRQRRTLNSAFREWLEVYAADETDVRSFDSLMKELRSVNSGRHFSREELNER